MAFTVSRPGGANNSEFEAYVRLLDQSGIDRGRAARTPEPETQQRWLPVWSNHDDAERFAAQMSRATQNQSWQVVEVDRHDVSEGPLGPLDIYIGLQSDGCAYDLHPHSRNLVLKKFPHARLRPDVFVGAERNANQQAQWPDPAWTQVAQLLTGLTAAELEELGGFRIYDPVRREVVWTSQPITAPGSRLAV